jgi:iron(II)-dependent oxidoreductase
MGGLDCAGMGRVLEDRLADARARTLALVADLPDEAMHRPLDPIMSPLVWDLAHIAAYEDLWAVHRLGGVPLLHEDLAATYDAFETPRASRGQIELLDRNGAVAYLEAVRARTLDVLTRSGPSDLHELVLRHELQHAETMRQALFLGGLPGGAPEELPALTGSDDHVSVPGGTFEVGATATGFAYDNERPRHAVDLGPFSIGRTPVTNATWRHFVEGGGYERREWWTDEGWAWKQCYDITHPLGWDDGPQSHAPVMHVSWFEADAFARSQEARLPTETEWERASTSGQLAGIGLVWEWTASDFAGYPGFAAYPYREYSEVFFGQGHRVLRGGSWATAPEVAGPTFRNWDLPQRRQIFSGLRLVREA